MDRLMSNVYYLFFIALITIFPLNVIASAGGELTPKSAVWENRSLMFEENKGQFLDDVKFLARSNGYTVALTDHAANIYFGRTEILSEVVTLQFLTKGKVSKIKGEGKLPTKTQYFFGNKKESWSKNNSNYSKVLYTDVYPGIDIMFHGNGRSLQFDYVVAPGSDPNDISFSLDGTKELKINDQGGIEFLVSGERAVVQSPKLYQVIEGERITINGKFILLENKSIAFNVAAYDKTKELVIDPTIEYSTFIGGSKLEYIYSVDVDDQGNSYIGGLTDSSDIALLANNSKPFGNRSGFVAKISNQGTLDYFTYLGGSGEDTTGDGVGDGSSTDVVTDLTIANNGVLYITGRTNSNDFPIVGNSSSFSGGNDVFIASLDSSGAIINSTYFGGNAYDSASSIKTDSSNNVYLAMHSSSRDISTTSNAYQPNYAGGPYDAVIAKFNSTLNTADYVTYLGGHYNTNNAPDGYDEPNALAVDNNGNVYVTGWTHSRDFPVVDVNGNIPPNANVIRQNNISGGRNVFVTKINSSGSGLVYSTLIGSDNAACVGQGIEIDNDGNAYIAGQAGAGLDGTINYNGGTYDAFVSKVNSSGSELIFSKYVGGENSDSARSISLSNNGNIYIAGYTTSPSSSFSQVNPLPGLGELQGVQDGFVSGLSASGETIFSTYIGGDERGYILGMTAKRNSRLDLVGFTASADFPIIGDAIQSQITPPADPNNYSESYDGTFMRISLNSPPAIECAVEPSLVQSGETTDGSSIVTDSDLGDEHTVTIDWGDGVISSDFIADSRVFYATHSYESAGVYTVTCNVEDSGELPASTIFEYVVVYDPSAGFVSGGGTVHSPEGAYLHDQTLSGKAVFGFTSKYHIGATEPSGNARFRFNMAGLDFQSVSYEWLVVAGARAQFRGEGEVNKESGYGFMLTAIDSDLPGGGDVDRFRIKIWDKETDEVIYDNQRDASDNSELGYTTTLIGGNIRIVK